MINKFVEAFASENNLDDAIAQQLTTWLTNEGVLDFGVIEDTYKDVTD